MKKIILILFCITIGYSLLNGEEQILIPDDAIRFRVIANSNELVDQELKMEVKKSVEKELNRLMSSAKSKEEAKTLIQNARPKIESLVGNFHVDFQMNYGMNEFPEKEYRGITYDAGKYESLVITLGSGLGENWWCVMFPPLCLLEAEETELDNVEYQFFVKNVLDKYLS
ncbi:MAG: stage II sporulation protein R [Bacilli bacterium]|nr:stage II sporulation protein R [Bacilli bacterium]